jgi:hypothetical protein
MHAKLYPLSRVVYPASVDFRLLMRIFGSFGPMNTYSGTLSA